MDHVAIIRSLGGAHSLSDAFASRGVAVAPVTVRSWSLRGRMIPAKYWSHIADIAHARGVTISLEALADQASVGRLVPASADKPEAAAA